MSELSSTMRGFEKSIPTAPITRAFSSVLAIPIFLTISDYFESNSDVISF